MHLIPTIVLHRIIQNSNMKLHRQRRLRKQGRELGHTRCCRRPCQHTQPGRHGRPGRKWWRTDHTRFLCYSWLRLKSLQPLNRLYSSLLKKEITTIMLRISRTSTIASRNKHMQESFRQMYYMRHFGGVVRSPVISEPCIANQFEVCYTFVNEATCLQL